MICQTCTAHEPHAAVPFQRHVRDLQGSWKMFNLCCTLLHCVHDILNLLNNEPDCQCLYYMHVHEPYTLYSRIQDCLWFIYFVYIIS